MVLAAKALVAWPNRGDDTSIMFVRFVWLNKLNASKLNSIFVKPLTSPSLFNGPLKKLKILLTRKSVSMKAGPSPVLRVTPGGRSFAMPSSLSSEPVVILKGAPEFATTMSPSLNAAGSSAVPATTNRCRISNEERPHSGPRLRLSAGSASGRGIGLGT